MKTESRNSMADDFNLELQFARLGFDYKLLLHTAKFINDWTVVLTARGILKHVNNKQQNLLFLFTLIQLGSEQKFVIYHIQSFLFTCLDNAANTRLVISKEYWDYPLPSKERICAELDRMRPINAVLYNHWNCESHLYKFWLLNYFADDTYLN